MYVRCSIPLKRQNRSGWKPQRLFIIWNNTRLPFASILHSCRIIFDRSHWQSIVINKDTIIMSELKFLFSNIGLFQVMFTGEQLVFTVKKSFRLYSIRNQTYYFKQNNIAFFTSHGIALMHSPRLLSTFQDHNRNSSQFCVLALPRTNGYISSYSNQYNLRLFCMMFPYNQRSAYSGFVYLDE